MFNCNHFLVSQINPHIAPLLNLKRSVGDQWGHILEAEIRHRCQVNGAIMVADVQYGYEEGSTTLMYICLMHVPFTHVDPENASS